MIVMCTINDACLGGISPKNISKGDENLLNGRCAEGHFGNLCNDCIEGYGN